MGYLEFDGWRLDQSIPCRYYSGDTGEVDSCRDAAEYFGMNPNDALACFGAGSLIHGCERTTEVLPSDVADTLLAMPYITPELISNVATA